MTSIGANRGGKVTEEAQRYHRAIEINTHLATVCLRKLTENCLVKAGKTLAEHLADSQGIIGNLRLFSDQIAILKSPNPDLNHMDITLLSVLLSRTRLPIQKTNKNHLNGIKENRNKLCHLPDCKLPNDAIFNQTYQSILSIAKTIDSNFYNEMAVEANDIRSQQLVKPVCTLDRFKMAESVYELKLLETTTMSTDEMDNEILIRRNLSRFARQITRGICPAKLMQHLKQIDPTLAQKLKSSPECYTNESEMSDYIMKIMSEPKTDLLKFCSCLRKVSPLIADLVENTNTDGQSTLECLIEDELSRIKDVLLNVFEKNTDESISSEELHLLVEKELHVPVKFDLVKRCVLDTFPDVKFGECDFRFQGLNAKEQKTPDKAESSHTARANINFHEQGVDEFAKYVAENLRERKIVDTPFETAIMEHSLSPLTFIDLTEPQMEMVFVPYLKQSGHKILGMGMKIALTQIQNSIKLGLQKIDIQPSDKTQDLREFNTTVANVRYMTGLVRTHRGNLLVAAHEFISDVYEIACAKLPPNNFVAKRVVRFAAACMNERKNGTIHFGIEQNDNTSGNIIGVPEENISIWKLDDDIFDAFSCSFGDETSKTIRCVNPVQCIPVEGGNVVIEVDIVLFSMYLTPALLSVKYPPKGSQSDKYFGLDKDGVFEIPQSDAMNESVKDMYNALLEQRKHLEYETRHKTKHDTKYLQAKLGKLLTRGNNYVTNHLTPVIISGPITHSATENKIRDDLCCERAFSSASFVFDFDSSSGLRESIERENSTFLIQVAEDHFDSFELEKDWRKDLPVWLYCNGYDDNSLPSMSHEDWMKERKHVTFKSMDMLRKNIQKGRGIVIFLIFGARKICLNPLLELARQTLLHVFERECLVISDNEKYVSYLKNEVKQVHGKDVVERLFFTELPWNEVSHVMNCVFKCGADVICRLPTSKGYFEEMTSREKQTLNLTDLCIVSGEECKGEEAMMDDEERKGNRKKSQERFYQGYEATWWNFYYNQVGKRDLLDTYKKEMLEQLQDESGHEFVKEQVIQHHPGAGGSTVGKHLIWEFSQFNGHPELSYRCCIVKSITKNTDKQIEKLRSFKDRNPAKPLIIMIDNKDEGVDCLVESLNSMASEHGRHGCVYCLVLHIQRVDIWQNDYANNILKHQLNPRETSWFEDKYEEMQRKAVNVDTLIAFNMMRNSFNKEYVRNTTSRVMAGVTVTEMDVLKCLALIQSFENRKLVPEEVFDDTMKVYQHKRIRSFRLSNHCRQLGKDNNHLNTTWNVRMTEAMSLLVLQVEQEDIAKCGMSIVSQLLAKAILDYFKMEKNITLETIVKYVLMKVKNKMNKTSQAASYFARLISSLFKTRHQIHGDKKHYFSELVQRLKEELTAEEGEKIAMDKVSQIIHECFTITKDPMVGQQLARFYIYTNQFDDAENTIQTSLHLSKNVFLYHTYGYTYRSKMRYLLKNRPETECGIPDNDAVEIVESAFKCISVLKPGQTPDVETLEQYVACHDLEVVIVLELLKACEMFSAIKNTRSFREFLNDLTFNVHPTSFQKLLKECPNLEELRVGRPTQTHMESSLRLLEDVKYKFNNKTGLGLHFKQKVSRLRTRFSHYYGNLKSCSYNHGFGFNHLQDAMISCPVELKEQFDISKRNLERNCSPKITDLLFYIGINALMSDICKNNDVVDFKKLLCYSKSLRVHHAEQMGERRAYLESYLYYGLFHWPLESRLLFEDLAGPEEYCKNMVDWEDSFQRNNFSDMGKHKVLFIIMNGTPGNDFSLFDTVKRFCQNEGQGVFSCDRILRFEGIVDNTGYFIKIKIKYPKHDEHMLKVNSQYRVYDLCHRHVTFALGFTWKSPVALDVREKPRQAIEDPQLYPFGSRKRNKKTDKTIGRTKTVKADSKDEAAVGTVVHVNDACEITSDKQVKEDLAKTSEPKKVKKKICQPSAQRKKKTAANTTVINDPDTFELNEELRDPKRKEEEEVHQVSNNPICPAYGLDSEKQMGAHIDGADTESSDDTIDASFDDKGAYSHIESPLSEGSMTPNITGISIDKDANTTSDESDMEPLGASETNTIRKEFHEDSEDSNTDDLHDSTETKMFDSVNAMSEADDKKKLAGDVCSDKHAVADIESSICEDSGVLGDVSDKAYDTCTKSSDFVQTQSRDNEKAELPTVVKTTAKDHSRRKKHKSRKHQNMSGYAGKPSAGNLGGGDA